MPNTPQGLSHGHQAEAASVALTVLQHEVIQRLRISGHAALAEEALDAWRVGRALESVYLGGDQERRADFDRANGQARKRS
jgi:hypothetical protein